MPCIGRKIFKGFAGSINIYLILNSVQTKLRDGLINFTPKPLA
jgi:hypothetical protein